MHNIFLQQQKNKKVKTNSNSQKKCEWSVHVLVRTILKKNCSHDANMPKKGKTISHQCLKMNLWEMVSHQKPFVHQFLKELLARRMNSEKG